MVPLFIACIDIRMSPCPVVVADDQDRLLIRFKGSQNGAFLSVRRVGIPAGHVNLNSPIRSQRTSDERGID
jgi:hypothetical protein